MNAIKARVQNGRVEAAAPNDWPEGTEVFIEPVLDEDWPGMREEDWPTTPAGIAALMKRWETIEPLEMSPEEEAKLEEWRGKIKEVSLVRKPVDLDGADG